MIDFTAVCRPKVIKCDSPDGIHQSWSDSHGENSPIKRLDTYFAKYKHSLLFISKMNWQTMVGELFLLNWSLSLWWNRLQIMGKTKRSLSLSMPPPKFQWYPSFISKLAFDYLWLLVVFNFGWSLALGHCWFWAILGFGSFLALGNLLTWASLALGHLLCSVVFGLGSSSL